jgi:hypothetical protein
LIPRCLQDIFVGSRRNAESRSRLKHLTNLLFRENGASADYHSLHLRGNSPQALEGSIAAQG